MTCDQFREELDLAFGQPELTAELKAHLASCEACRKYAAQLEALVPSLGDDSAFATDSFEVNRVAWKVEQGIAAESAKKRSWIGSIRYVAAAAVIVLAAAIGYDQYQKSLPVEVAAIPDTGKIVRIDSNDIPTGNLEMSDTEIEQMLLDYSAQDDQAAGEMLQNLTDEEVQYLEKNFDVGELL